MASDNSAYTDWKHWQVQDFGRFDASEARYFAWHLARALPGSGVPLQILELGFGNGNFIGWARAQGHQVQGVEALPELVERAQQAGITAAASLQDLPSTSRYDLIAAFDVIEHVPMTDLPGLLVALRERLRPGGRMLLRFPNAESPFGLCNQYGDLTHVSALGVSRMRQLVPGCGLQLEHVGNSLPWRLEAQGRLLRGWLRHLARKRFERSLRKFYGIGHVDYSPNQLVVLRAADPA